ncbi:MAG: hypothetical protein DRN37_00095 [Thermoplasmata archaeon]|nr:MAG: hypothetical protein DRN37_00095 [Thermoplasmata archaeon]
MKGSVQMAFAIITLFSVMGATSGPSGTTDGFRGLAVTTPDDYSPLVDIAVTIEILAIRALDTIDTASGADFFVTLTINGVAYRSPVWNDSDVLYPYWNLTVDVPDDIKTVTITMALTDWNTDGPVLCDIGSGKNSDSSGYTVTVVYDIATGRWSGDDFIGDASGYGRASGCDDGSIYENEKDCEMWFTIYQNDYDHDGLPYWMETNEYGTDPTVDNRGEDPDGDNIPIEWEHRWGFDPFHADAHTVLDPDNDSITNMEEFLTSSAWSDPFRRDIFLEVDFMDRSSVGKASCMPDNAVELLKNPFHRRNIVFHVETGGFVPMDGFTDPGEVLDIYRHHFIQGDRDAWRRSVFHYGIFVHNCFPTGYSFAGDGPTFWGYLPGTNAFVVSASMMERYHLLSPGTSLDFFYASVIMHEMGHNFGIKLGTPMGCDNQFTKYPWQLGWYLYRNYKSIMNYRYTYEILDYSDGSHGKRDFDDWSYINLSYFELPPCEAMAW